MLSTDKKSIRVLDAGCGRQRPFGVVPPDAYVVGLDISHEALALNEGLSERIVGDLQTYPLPASSFDVIICNDVLEHLEEPNLALANLARALAPSGRMYLGLPRVTSAKALITKFTPTSFHVWVYRRLLSHHLAGTPGYGPFPTYLSFRLAPASLRRWAGHSGLSIEQFIIAQGYVVNQLIERFPPLNVCLRIVWPFGDPRMTELQIVLKKDAESTSH